MGENLPFRDNQFDFALLVTVICFVKDAARLLRETRRVLKVGALAIIGFIDKNSALGQIYQSRKETDRFYREACFYSTAEVIALLTQAGFYKLQFCQTIMGLPDSGQTAYRVRPGCGEGAFVTINTNKSSCTDIQFVK